MNFFITIKIINSKTKVFLKYYHYDELQVLLNHYINKSIIIQKSKNFYGIYNI